MGNIGSPPYPQLSLVLHLQHSIPFETPFLETSTISIPQGLTLKHTLSLQKTILKIASQRSAIEISEHPLSLGDMLFLLEVKSKLALVSAAIGKDNFALGKIGKVELNEILSVPTLNAHLMGQTTLPTALDAYSLSHCHAFAFSSSLSKPSFHTQARTHYLQPALPMRHLILGPALVEILMREVDEALLSAGIGKNLIGLSLFQCHTNSPPLSFLLFRRKAKQPSRNFIPKYLIELASIYSGDAQSLTGCSHLKQMRNYN